jgi:hypothetical protein
MFYLHWMLSFSFQRLVREALGCKGFLSNVAMFLPSGMVGFESIFSPAAVGLACGMQYAGFVPGFGWAVGLSFSPLIGKPLRFSRKS